MFEKEDIKFPVGQLSVWSLWVSQLMIPTEDGRYRLEALGQTHPLATVGCGAVGRTLGELWSLGVHTRGSCGASGCTLGELWSLGVHTRGAVEPRGAH